MQTMTFSSASTSLDNFQVVEVNHYGGSLSKNGAGVLRVFGTATASGADETATLELALVKNGERVGYWQGTATTVDQQQGSAYMLTVAWDETSTSKIDLLGCSSYSLDEASANSGDKYVWMLGATAFSTLTAIQLTMETGPVI